MLVVLEVNEEVLACIAVENAEIDPNAVVNPDKDVPRLLIASTFCTSISSN
jgi:hypothetical protein